MLIQTVVSLSLLPFTKYPVIFRNTNPANRKPYQAMSNWRIDSSADGHEQTPSQ